MDVPPARVAASALVLPALAAASAAIRYQFGPGISVCLVVALVLAPVWLGALRHYRFARSLLVLALLAIAWGTTVSLLDAARPFSSTLLIAQTSQLLSLVGAAGLLLWARSSIGVGWTVAAFGFGALANVVLTGGNVANLWKYSLAIPIVLLVLGISMHWRSRLLPVVLLTVFAGISAVSDSRSMTSFLLLAAAAMLWQASVPRIGDRARPWQMLLLLAVAGLAAFSLLQALILDGVLGEAAAQRSAAQIDTSGSLITGGRPELGAGLALIGENPLGYGSGTVPVSSDVWLAKSGMDTLGYNPDNGYVEVFMFGGHYEVHSVLGDLWIWFGPLGAVVAVLIVVVGAIGTASRMSTRTASAALVLLAVLGAWDTLFSPMLTSYRTLALLFAVAALPMIATTANQQLSPASPTSRRSAAPGSGSSRPRSGRP
ncbi:hypothetical protein [Agrococcus baldri]|uniref:O-antigen ligase n=1 Tax=Agrococcus baldri TaxID=153730 RepID=A0AA87UVS6_9MICO|nr:hypothetical protein [Agrococcus baldri]GEK78812.1 hypothetical protein ABA31_01630 [Agrococcus baldri]